MYQHRMIIKCCNWVKQEDVPHWFERLFGNCAKHPTCNLINQTMYNNVQPIRSNVCEFSNKAAWPSIERKAFKKLSHFCQWGIVSTNCCRCSIGYANINQWRWIDIIYLINTAWSPLTANPKSRPFVVTCKSDTECRQMVHYWLFL